MAEQNFSFKSPIITLVGTDQEPKAPPPPVLLLVEVGSTYVDLSWGAVIGAVEYELYVDDLVYDSYPAASSRLRVTGLVNWVEHSFRVRAVSAISELYADSNIVSATPVGQSVAVDLPGFRLDMFRGLVVVQEPVSQFVQVVGCVATASRGTPNAIGQSAASVSVRGFPLFTNKPVVTTGISWAPAAGFRTFFQWPRNVSGAPVSAWGSVPAEFSLTPIVGDVSPVLDTGIPAITFNDSPRASLESAAMDFTGAVLVGARMRPLSTGPKEVTVRPFRFGNSHYYYWIDNTVGQDRFGMYNNGTGAGMWGPVGSYRDTWHSVLWWHLSASSIGTRLDATETVDAVSTGQRTSFLNFQINEGSQACDFDLQAVVIYTDTTKFDTIAKRDAIITALNAAGTSGVADAAVQVTGLRCVTSTPVVSVSIQAAVNVSVFGLRLVSDKGIVSAGQGTNHVQVLLGGRSAAVSVGTPTVTANSMWVPVAPYKWYLVYGRGITGDPVTSWADAVAGVTLSSNPGGGTGSPALDNPNKCVTFNDAPYTGLLNIAVDQNLPIGVGLRMRMKATNVVDTWRQIIRFANNYFYCFRSSTPGDDRFGMYTSGSILFPQPSTYADAWVSVLFWSLTANIIGVTVGNREIIGTTSVNTAFNDFTLNGNNPPCDMDVRALVVYDQVSAMDTPAKRAAIIANLDTSDGTAVPPVYDNTPPISVTYWGDGEVWVNTDASGNVLQWGEQGSNKWFSSAGLTPPTIDATGKAVAFTDAPTNLAAPTVTLTGAGSWYGYVYAPLGIENAVGRRIVQNSDGTSRIGILADVPV